MLTMSKETNKMKCKKPDGTFTTVTYKFYYAQCTRNLQILNLCSGSRGAWVPAVTVCQQRLF